MTLVDPYHDRVFRNGRVYGVNYDEQTMKPTYSDISPFGGGRMAGDGLVLILTLSFIWAVPPKVCLRTRAWMPELPRAC